MFSDFSILKQTSEGTNRVWIYRKILREIRWQWRLSLLRTMWVDDRNESGMCLGAHVTSSLWHTLLVDPFTLLKKKPVWHFCHLLICVYVVLHGCCGSLFVCHCCCAWHHCVSVWVSVCLSLWVARVHRPESSSGLIWFPHSWLMWNSSPDVAEITTPCCVCGGVVAVQENKHNGTIFSAHRPTLMNQASSTETELPVLSVSRHQITSTKHVASIVHVLWCGTLGYITYLGEIMCEKWNTC